ncbi:homoserine dehydrogenase [Aristaeella hokkaidonensis]|uniref:Homoserine dehydrogenase n=1 Tax=Aristaeella hokkaidonensis TaxID=3046382 RepID=A0AC61MXT2_9FIRM|nr:homoserine dehydrogenase [Aristaeella hokkaidonensis]QUC66553.1 homoserine dehydrogenase [Aristaeella hokkaidonensis]SNT95137.1 homoserine dehydrogenase [Aristaeella hokkaidonensis]
MKEVVLGLLGLGNIGGGVWDLIREFGGEVSKRTGVKLVVKKALVLDKKIHRGKEVPDEVLTTEKNDILEDPEIDIVCEFLGGEQPAASMMLRALENGKSVVTANKMALSLHFDELREMAKKTGAGLYYEASVGGAIPIINAIQTPLIANHIEQMMGIVNGTTNYILTRMAAEGAEYEIVLKDAQRLGLAEPNPTADVEGYDAAYKLSILGSLAFHSRVLVENVYREGITKVNSEDIAFGREMGYVLKLLAIGKDNGDSIEARVHPAFLPADHPLARVDGSLNAVYLYGHSFKDMMLEGRGAGDAPTASAIVGDIVQAAQNAVHPMPVMRKDPLPVADDWYSKYFIRMKAKDAPGVLAEVAGLLAKEEISVSAMTQKDAGPDGKATLIIITHMAPEKAVQRVVKALNPEICKVENVIRVEG